MQADPFSYSSRGSMNQDIGTCQNPASLQNTSANDENLVRRRSDRMNRLIDFCNILAAFIGSNYLSASYSFKQGGLVFAGVVWGINIILNHYCCWLIIHCKYTMIEKLMERFDATGSPCDPTRADRRQNLRRRLRISCQVGHLAEFAYGRLGRICFEFAVALTHFAIATVYFIFIADTFLICFNDIPFFIDHPGININITKYCEAEPTLPYAQDKDPRDSTTMIVCFAVLFVLFLCSSFVQKVRELGAFSSLGTAFVFVGSGILIYLLFSINGAPCEYPLFQTKDFPVFIGMMVPVFEGVGMMLPIENEMKGNRKSFSIMLAFAVYIVGTIVFVIGAKGYLIFYDGTKDIILVNLAQISDPYLTLSTCICFIIGVLFMYPLQNLPCIQLLEKWFFAKGTGCSSRRINSTMISEMDCLVSHLSHESIFMRVRTNTNALHESSPTICLEVEATKFQQFLVRFLLITAQCLVSYLIRHFYGLLFAFIGAIASFLLVFIFPCALSLRLEWFETGKVKRLINILIIMFSVSAALVALIGTIIAMFDKESWKQ